MNNVFNVIEYTLVYLVRVVLSVLYIPVYVYTDICIKVDNSICRLLGCDDKI